MKAYYYVAISATMINCLIPIQAAAGSSVKSLEELAAQALDPKVYAQKLLFEGKITEDEFKLLFDTLYGEKLTELVVKEGYFLVGERVDRLGWLTPYFKGVSIQDLIDHDRMNDLQNSGLLENRNIASLDGYRNIPGINNIKILFLTA